eukprot:CAMPEP_0184298206 /NCGR_PEP_ID=MMETSP1049-20130417/9046_1 /TAXON_ID=77928 /ORGANISM="Proteomonas sulcata, Strain CCMP704" /LENGTH=151 /DNA_ID=CAMNT_0026608271 /DNA_START=803 /DNA_END=1259 /DNA_ORIENTATION=+
MPALKGFGDNLVMLSQVRPTVATTVDAGPAQEILNILPILGKLLEARARSQEEFRELKTAAHCSLELKALPLLKAPNQASPGHDPANQRQSRAPAVRSELRKTTSAQLAAGSEALRTPQPRAAVRTPPDAQLQGSEQLSRGPGVRSLLPDR